MKTVRIATGESIYSVRIGEGLLPKVGELLRRVNKSRKLALVTDDVVGPEYGVAASASFTHEDYEVIELTVPAGEASKHFAVVEQLVETYASQELGRRDIIVAMGGGVVGDLVGFTAAIYLRGVKFVQIPTTLLAMVDSSIGGKTGINIAAGKNLVGAFKQPEEVIMDLSTLSTLPDAEWRSGFAEIAKTALIEGPGFWNWIRENATALVAHDTGSVTEAIARCVRFKGDVVAKDEKESGLRECLNYGHTLGHAIERVAGYGSISHGEAVAEGMRFASRLAVEALGAPISLVQEQDALLDTLGLPALRWSAYPGALLSAMRADKKSRSGRIRFVLPTAPGQWEAVVIDTPLLQAHLDAWFRSKEAMGIVPDASQAPDVDDATEQGASAVEEELEEGGRA